MNIGIAELKFLVDKRFTHRVMRKKTEFRRLQKEIDKTAEKSTTVNWISYHKIAKSKVVQISEHFCHVGP